jgi:hypothetical protein
MGGGEVAIDEEVGQYILTGLSLMSCFAFSVAASILFACAVPERNLRRNDIGLVCDVGIYRIARALRKETSVILI